MNNSMANCCSFNGNDINVRMSNIDFASPVTAAVATSFEDDNNDDVGKIKSKDAVIDGSGDDGEHVEDNNGDNDDDFDDNEDEKKLQLCRCCGKSNKELYPLYMMKCNSNNDAVAAAAAAADNNSTATRIADGSCNNTNTNTQQALPITDATTTANEAVELMLNAFAKNSHKMDIILEETHIWQLQIQHDDGLPQDICRQCTAQFYMVRKFRRKCLKVQARLRADYERMQQKQHERQHQQPEEEQEEAQAVYEEDKLLDDKLEVKTLEEEEKEILKEQQHHQCKEPQLTQPIVETLSDILDEERILKAHVIYKQCSPKRPMTSAAYGAIDDVEMKELALIPNVFDVSQNKEYSKGIGAGAVMTTTSTTTTTPTTTNEHQKTEENAPAATIPESKIRLKIRLTTPAMSSLNATKRDMVKAIQRRHRRIQVTQRTVRTRSMANQECNKTAEHQKQQKQPHYDMSNFNNNNNNNNNNISTETTNTSTCNQFAHDDESVALAKNQPIEVIEHKPSKRARMEAIDEDQVKLPWKTKAARKEIPNAATAQITETIRREDASRIPTTTTSTTATMTTTSTTETGICKETAAALNVPAIMSTVHAGNQRNEDSATACLTEVNALPSGRRHQKRCRNKMGIFIKKLPVQIRNKAITKILQEKQNENLQLNRNRDESCVQQLSNVRSTEVLGVQTKSVLQLVEKVFLPEDPAAMLSATAETKSNLALTTTQEIFTESTVKTAVAFDQCKLSATENEQNVAVKPHECTATQLESKLTTAVNGGDVITLNDTENRTKENNVLYDVSNEDDELMVRIPLSSLTDAFKRRIADTVKSTDCDVDDQAVVYHFELNKENKLNGQHFLKSAVVDSSNATTERDYAAVGIGAINDETLSIPPNKKDRTALERSSLETQSEFFGFNNSFESSTQTTTTNGKVTKQQEPQQAQSTCPDKINDLFADLQLHCEVTSCQKSVENDHVDADADAAAVDDDNNDETIVEPKISTDNAMLDNNNDEMNDVESTLNGILNEMQDQHIYTPVTDFLTPPDYSPLTEQTLQEASPTASDDVSSVYVPSPAVLMTVSTESYDESQQQQQQQQQPHDDRQQEQTQTIINDAEPTATQTTLNEFFSNAFTNYEQVFPEDANVQANLIGFQNDIPCFENINTTTNSANITLPQTHVPNVTTTALTTSSNSALRGTRQLAELIQSTTTSGDVANQHPNAAATSTIGIISGAVNQTLPIFMSNQTVAATATAATTTTQPTTATVASTLQIELSELLDELQPTATTSAHEQHSAANNTANNTALNTPDQLLNTNYTYAQLQPISQASNDGGKLQFITLPQVTNVHEYQQQQQHQQQQQQQQQQQHFAQQPLQHTQLQWSAAGGLESIRTTSEPITAASLPTGTTTTTTTYYINTADLYQPTFDNATLATLTTLQQQQQQQQNTQQQHQQQQQTQILELDKHHTLVDGNENYLETTATATASATMNNGQQIMIVIPHGSSSTASADVHNPVASASNPHQAPLQLYSNSELHTLGNIHHHQHQHHQQQQPPPQQQQQPHQQTVLLQTPPRSHKSTGGGSHVFLTSTPLTQQQQQQQQQHCVTPNTLHYTLSPSTSPVTQSPLSCSVAAAAAATAATATTTTPPLLTQKGTSSDRISLNCRFCHSRPRFTNYLEYSKHIIEMHPAPAPFNCPHCPLLFPGRAKRQQHIIEQHFSRRFPCGQCGQAFASQRTLDLHLQRNHALLDPSNGGGGAGGAGTTQHFLIQQQQCVDVEDVQLQMTEEHCIDGATDIESSGTKITCEVIRTPEAKKHTRILCCPDCDDSNSDEHCHGSTGEEPMLTIVHDQQEMTTMTACPSPAISASPPTPTPTPLSMTNSSPISGAHITLPSPEQSEPDSTSTTTLRQFRRRRTSPITPTATGGCIGSVSGSTQTQQSAPSPSSSPSSSTADTMHLGELRSAHNCIYCSAHFTNDIALRKHHQLAHREQTYMPFVCSTCKRGFRMRPALQRHMETHNSEGRPFECDTCHVRFPRRSQLRLHIITVHMLTKPHTCEECGKQFGTESALNTHIKFHGERKFECSICKFRFFLKKDLRKHWRIHTGEKFYKCDLCTDSFLHYSRFSAHISGHIPPGVFVNEDKTVRPNEEMSKVDEKLQLTDLNTTTGMKINVLKPNDISTAATELNTVVNNNNNMPGK